MKSAAGFLAILCSLVLTAAPAGARECGAGFRPGDTLVSALSPPGDMDDWFFGGVAGEKVLFSAAGEGAGPVVVLALFAPDGSEVGTVKSAGAKTILTATLPVTGRYRLLVGASGGGEGAYRIATKGKRPSVLRFAPVPLRPGGTAEFEVFGDDLSFLSLRIGAPKDAGFEVLDVLDPGGMPVFGALDAFGPERRARTAGFPVYSGFGTYVIRFGNAAGDITVSLLAKVTTPKRAGVIRPVPGDEPRPTGVSPPLGPPGTRVTISGTGFSGDDAVFFGDTPAKTVRVVSATTVEAWVPSTAPRDMALDVSVRSPEGTENPLVDAFTVRTPPTVSAVAPGLLEPGGRLTITGFDFAAAATVCIGSATAPSVDFLDSGHLVVVVPEDLAEGRYGVTVRNPDQLISSLIGAVAVEWRPAIEGVDPREVERGDLVRLRGEGFVPGTEVSFSGVAVPAAFVSPAEMTAVMPAPGPADGLLDVAVKKPLGSEASLAGALVLYPSPAGDGLVITGIIDGPRSGGQPKAVELRATADVADLSRFALRLASNGSPWSATLALAGSASKGQFLYAAAEAAGFADYFGFAPDFTSATVLNLNGNDAVGLFLDGGMVDVYGNPAEVASSSDFRAVWTYQDGYAVRKVARGPRADFDPGEWTFSGNDLLDAQGSSGQNGSAGIVVPFGTWSWR